MALIPPFFVDSVVALGTRSATGAPTNWSASGFLYGDFVSSEGEMSSFSVYLVTNRHVFADTERMIVRFNPKGNDPAKEFDLDLIDAAGSQSWLAHPDPEVDVAIIRINANALEEAGIQFGFFQSHRHVLDRAGATAGGVTEGDGAYILGFPLGLVGADRSFVIVRQGCIARIRDWLAGGAKEFRLDTTVFPGNSGGPAVLRPEATAITGTTVQRASYLLGIVKGYLTYSDMAISAQTQRPRVIFEENAGLAQIVPVDFIQETIRIHAGTVGPAPVAEEAEVPKDGPPEIPIAARRGGEITE